MGEAENQPADHAPDHGDAGADSPPTVELLADLQAGLLNDEAAARLRGQVRDDPEAEGALRALNQVRRDVAAVREHPLIGDDILVGGFMYDVDNGRLTQIT